MPNLPLSEIYLYFILFIFFCGFGMNPQKFGMNVSLTLLDIAQGLLPTLR